MKSFILFLSFLISFNSFAAVNQFWSGDGEVRLEYPKAIKKVICPDVTFKMKQNEQILHWDVFTMKCINSTGGITELDYSGFTFKLDGNQILFRNEVVGNISKDKFRFDIHELGDEALFTLEGSIVNNELHLVMEEYFTLEGAYFKYSFKLD